MFIGVAQGAVASKSFPSSLVVARTKIKSKIRENIFWRRRIFLAAVFLWCFWVFWLASVGLFFSSPVRVVRSKEEEGMKTSLVFLALCCFAVSGTDDRRSGSSPLTLLSLSFFFFFFSLLQASCRRSFCIISSHQRQLTAFGQIVGSLLMAPYVTLDLTLFSIFFESFFWFIHQRDLFISLMISKCPPIPAGMVLFLPPSSLPKLFSLFLTSLYFYLLSDFGGDERFYDISHHTQRGYFLGGLASQ
jgi:hypothetical protein